VQEIRHYLTSDGKDIFRQWYDKLRDTKARIAIDRRINRIELGNFGDHKSLREGIWELRIDVGPGYRAYYGIAGTQVVLLLLGGDKRTQAADIDRACNYWRDWQERG
jgi:putative addiction module killer protein